MDLLQWQQTDNNQFAVFIRDLTVNLNNLKHMIEDSFQKEEKPKHSRKGKKNNKVVKKKKDIIIDQQNKIRLEKNTKEDLSKLDYILSNLDNENPYPSFQLMKTEEGLLKLKFRMLHHLWSLRKDHFPHVMNLYFQLVDKDVNPEQTELISKIKYRLEDTEYKLYMMKHLSHLLPPLNIHEPTIKKLDDWQIQVVTHIKQGESVIVKAPTSAGKSFVALAAGVIHRKLLYVCPAKPIAYQVGAHFNLMGYKVHYLLDNLCHQGYDDKTNIFVGVPSTIEDNLYKLGVTFDYAVFDEIHNLNKEDDGNIYENILKLIRCPFLALSATIGNIEYLQEILTKIHNDELTNARAEQRKNTLLELGDTYELNTRIRYIEYTKRFINQQKMVYDNGLHKLHPLSCISIVDLDDSFLKQNLQFTPYDSAVLWEKLEEIFEDNDLEEVIEDYSPDSYFEDKCNILTLDDTRDYEQFIKCKLVQLSSSYPELIKEVLQSFHRKRSILRPEEPMKDIIQLFRECKENDCLPMLVFNTDTLACKKLFTQLFDQIAKSELDEYPYHYDILEKKEKLYTKYEEKRIVFIENIKINKNSKDAHTDKQTKIDRYDKAEQQRYIHDVLSYYEQCIHNCGRNDTISDALRKLQIKNLIKEMKDYKKYPSFGSVDLFQKHKDFCFTTTDPMTGDQIRQIRREIKKTLGIKISYEHELFQMLKRGIGIYTEDMPDEYKWILQRLMGDKKIGIVISDRTLCLGIDLPIRSSCLLGLPGSKKFTIDDYLQMSGRAGRRGKDDRGNTIFYNLDYEQLMKGQLPDIIGSDKEIPCNYRCLNVSTDEVYRNPVHYNKIRDPMDYIETSIPGLQWFLRYERFVPEFIQGIDKWNKIVFRSNEGLPKELEVLRRILSMVSYDTDVMIHSYKKKVIGDEFNDWKHVIRLLQIVYNSLKDKKYIHLKKIMTNVHSVIKDMILKYQGLN